ncbi:radial spoke head 10 homolog B-like [Tubulanus polymorphus]|uniref:radial spoke head 10 homolog B-like n=1 Tax=Tubulanus polymorphus TaxID=672921 RepID=UPI003DA2EF20
MSSKKSRTAKSDEKKGRRSEETTPQLTTESPEKKSGTESATPGPGEESTEIPDVKTNDTAETSPTPPSEPVVYEEPVLTKLIVECYEGDKEKGLYDGEGVAKFAGDHQYEGKFSEGVMHGTGTYTWSDGVVYEGEFYQNQITGKGVYTWSDGSTYEGEVVSGIRHGFGTWKSKDGEKSYTGEWLFGKKHGKGRMNYDSEGNTFHEGDWVKNIRHGWGTRKYPSGNVYEGMWFGNVRHGEGTMRWLDRDEMYTGQWENGIQHGTGQHIWFLRRVPGSQYPMRNMYEGQFVRGLRHGYGVFYYANGARYEGDWKDNMKQGNGKFIFKNGRVYEGVFERDHIVEYPSFSIDGMNTPDMTLIRTRTPLPMENMSVHSNLSQNTMSPSIQVEVDRLLQEFPDIDREEEAKQVLFVMMRYMTKLRKIYNFYSSLGYEESPDNTFIMNRMQFWRFLKDCKLHHHDVTLIEMDRYIAKMSSGEDIEKIHTPDRQILFREFAQYLVVLAYVIYHEQHEENECEEPVMAWCFSKIISDDILRNACAVGGHFYYEPRRAVNALVHVDQAYEVYKSLCTPTKRNPNEKTLNMRQFLFMLKDYKLINEDLTAKAIVNTLATDDCSIKDGEGAINLELEMTFLEFFEGLVGCAQVFVTEAVVKDPSTPRPSTTLTREQSMMSLPVSASRGASQIEEGAEDGHESLPPSGTPATQSPVVRTTSSIDGKPDVQASNTTNPPSESITDVNHATSQHSAKNVASEIGVDQKKSNSFTSPDQQTNAGGTIDDQGGARSVLSANQSEQASLYDRTGAETVDQEGENVEDELDENTRQFNFWTHQVHIFYVRKFFPAADKMNLLQELVMKKTIDPTAHYADCLFYGTERPRELPPPPEDEPQPSEPETAVDAPEVSVEVSAEA